MPKAQGNTWQRYIFPGDPMKWYKGSSPQEGDTTRFDTAATPATDCCGVFL